MKESHWRVTRRHRTSHAKTELASDDKANDGAIDQWIA
jgi:hypothetical protein